jgi:hypothetical protein
MSLDDDLARWEAGYLSREELIASYASNEKNLAEPFEKNLERNLVPELALVKMLDLHERLVDIGGEPVPYHESDWEQLRDSLPDRLPTRRVFGTGRLARPFIAASMVVGLSAGAAAASPTVREHMVSIWHGIEHNIGLVDDPIQVEVRAPITVSPDAPDGTTAPGNSGGSPGHTGDHPGEGPGNSDGTTGGGNTGSPGNSDGTTGGGNTGSPGNSGGNGGGNGENPGNGGGNGGGNSGEDPGNSGGNGGATPTMTPARIPATVAGTPTMTPARTLATPARIPATVAGTPARVTVATFPGPPAAPPGRRAAVSPNTSVTRRS